MGGGRKEAASMEESTSVPDFDPLLDSEIYDDSAYPISIPSQPPDIRNWFCSYKSQQPADSDEHTQFLNFHDLNGSETQDPYEDSRKRKLQEPCSSPEKEQHILGEDIIARDDGLNSSKDVFGKKSNSTDTVAAKKKCNLRKILGDEFLKGCQNSMIEHQSIVPENSMICPKGDNHEDHSTQKKRKEDNIHRTVAKPDENISETGFISPKTRPNLSLHGNTEKENRNKRINSDGFRRPMIDRTNHTDNYCKDGDFRGCLVIRTDIPIDVVATEETPSGKWRCPRKRKPYVGPQMKQLGLERWIRRSN